MSAYLRPLLRFWWIVIPGLALAIFVGLLAVYHVSFGLPPKLEERAQRTYTASAQLLVTSAEAPHLRTSVQQEETSTSPAGVVRGVNAAPPQIEVLVNAANLYPLLIESDQVARRRQRMFGPLPGAVTARGIYAFSSPNKFELSRVPVIEVVGSTDRERSAVRLVAATVDAFVALLDDQQRAAGLAPSERIVIQQLRAPRGAVGSGGSSLALPALLIATVFAAACALAILLDRLFPARRGLRVRRHRLETAGQAPKTAA